MSISGIDHETHSSSDQRATRSVTRRFIDRPRSWRAASRPLDTLTPVQLHTPTAGSARHRFARVLRDIGANRVDRLALGITVLTAVGLWALGQAHVVSREPLWLWVLVLLTSLVITFLGERRWRLHPSPALAHGRIALQVGVITVIMFMTGWGPVLGVGYIVIVRDLITQMGSRYWRALAIWCAVGSVAGSLAIAARIAPSLLSRPTVYGLAGLVGVATVIAIVLLGISGEEVEATQASLVKSEGKLRRTIETALDAYIELDGPTGTVVEWNSQAELIFGWSRREAIGQRYADLVFPPAHKAEFEIMLAQAIEEDRGSERKRRAERIYQHRDGHEIPVEISWWPTENADGLRFNLFLQDITSRVAATADLQRSTDNFRLLFEKHPHPMWVYDLATLRFLEVNHGATVQYGYTRDEFLAMTIADIRPQEDVALLLDTVRTDRPGLMRSGVWRHETKSGELLDVEVSSHLLDFNGHAGVLVMAQDVTERCRLEKQLREHALHDPLTGLPNRTLLLDRTDQLMAQAERSQACAAIICLNLDHFKLINDAYGHDGGDALLRAVAARLSGALRAVDTVGRMAGDGFVILTAPPEPDSDPELVAQKMLDLVRSRPFHVDGHDLFVTASVGINPGVGRDGAELLHNADVALRVAKTLGGNRHAVFAQAMQTAVHERLELALDLRDAILTGQFECFYQPVVRLKDVAIVGVEALARWRHPERGLLPPAQFIPLAEELGIIDEIGEFVLREACAQGARWQRQYEHLSVAVNVSVFQLRSNEFLSTVIDALERSQFNPENLVLEITESVLINDPETIITRLRSLKEIGVRLAIDDFGTGYSSLSYLQQLPFDILKIDQSFIASIGDSAETLTMLRTMIRMGRQLNLEIVAEGVENEHQLRLLQRMRCQNAQGYLLARPQDEATTTTTLREWALHGGPVHQPRRHLSRSGPRGRTTRTPRMPPCWCCSSVTATPRPSGTGAATTPSAPSMRRVWPKPGPWRSC
jgi:diguanylate cyclase (GGDEF)-like protein/PAS domain S-box-containing protein